LNNVNKLRSLVAKCYKNMHPYGQGNLGVLYSVQCKKFDMHNYVRRKHSGHAYITMPIILLIIYIFFKLQ